MRKIIVAIGMILIFIGIVALYPTVYSPQNSTVVPQVTISSQPQTNTITYKGQNGKDALTLLKQKTTVEQNKSGLVVSIGGNKPTGHEYWAFYVNGKYAKVGPAQYVTKNTDVILWKIEKY